MSEYWKSTPSYWCKFCSQYVRDSPLERKNHDASGRHQNNISRSLRELHKGQERETRDKQRAKDEVARLNGLFSGKTDSARGAGSATASTSRVAAPPPPSNVNPAAQRKAHAEQLAAMGVALPEELKKEVTGVGNYHVVSERALDHSDAGAVSVNRSLAEILAETKREPQDVKQEQQTEKEAKPTLKRELEEDEDEESAPKRKAWGSNFKVYPGANDDGVDLDALLSDVAKKKEPPVKTEGNHVIKEEQAEGEQPTSLSTIPDTSEAVISELKPESAAEATPTVLFKKRKGKK